MGSWNHTGRSVGRYLSREVHAAPLALFRILFGALMLWSLIRFASKGWIRELYIEPKLFFSYYGFGWVQPIGEATGLIFVIAGLAALGILLGYRTKWSIGLFFLSFTWIELMDKTTYLNHYYFVSVLSFLMLFLPMGAYASLDAWRDPNRRAEFVPAWTIWSIQLLLGIVYFYAGLAKLNSDWLLQAMPLGIWLTSSYDFPLLGELFQERWVHYLFSWSGALYDLSIPFLLLWHRTRLVAFVLVVFFHLMTRMLFPIGMFPYIMIACTLIFFRPDFHRKILGWLFGWLSLSAEVFNNGRTWEPTGVRLFRFQSALLGIFFLFQLLFPFRHHLYPGELFWTEEGFRFSWRVMLIDKTGHTEFRVVNPDTKRSWTVDNREHLTPFQEREMATQPDFILEYAHWLAEYYRNKGVRQPEIYAASHVALNGRLNQRFVDPEVNLANEPWNLKHKTWILPLNDTIYGL